MNDKMIKDHSDDFEMRRAEGSSPPKPASKGIIAQHTVKSGDTLSHISLQYYGSATEPYWRVIYEANKEIIGDDPNKVKRGLELAIPQLPDGMQMKK